MSVSCFLKWTITWKGDEDDKKGDERETNDPFFPFLHPVYYCSSSSSHDCKLCVTSIILRSSSSRCLLLSPFQSFQGEVSGEGYTLFCLHVHPEDSHENKTIQFEFVQIELPIHRLGQLDQFQSQARQLGWVSMIPDISIRVNCGQSLRNLLLLLRMSVPSDIWIIHEQSALYHLFGAEGNSLTQRRLNSCDLKVDSTKVQRDEVCWCWILVRVGSIEWDQRTCHSGTRHVVMKHVFPL